jgi:hypothetical protein
MQRAFGIDLDSIDAQPLKTSGDLGYPMQRVIQTRSQGMFIVIDFGKRSHQLLFVAQYPVRNREIDQCAQVLLP